ncbi:hypothetical protein ACLOJK_033202 [Asimina triloba]
MGAAPKPYLVQSYPLSWLLGWLLKVFEDILDAVEPVGEDGEAEDESDADDHKDQQQPIPTGAAATHVPLLSSGRKEVNIEKIRPLPKPYIPVYDRRSQA